MEAQQKGSAVQHTWKMSQPAEAGTHTRANASKHTYTHTRTRTEWHESDTYGCCGPTQARADRPTNNGVWLGALKAVITAFPSISLPFLAVPLLSQRTRPGTERTGLPVDRVLGHPPEDHQRLERLRPLEVLVAADVHVAGAVAEADRVRRQPGLLGGVHLDTGRGQGLGGLQDRGTARKGTALDRLTVEAQQNGSAVHHTCRSRAAVGAPGRSAAPSASMPAGERAAETRQQVQQHTGPRE
eukprot:SAG22_NODE_130_length_18670_cov_12.091379_6_plen_242_part_00